MRGNVYCQDNPDLMPNKLIGALPKEKEKY